MINLLSNDLGKFDLAIAFLHDLWKGPFEVFLLGYLSYREIGYAGIVGILVIISFVPIQCEYQNKIFNACLKSLKCPKIEFQLLSEKWQPHIESERPNEPIFECA